MRRAFYLFVFVFMINFALGITADLSCPKNVKTNEEFICKISVGDISGSYDVKMEIEKDGKTMADIWSSTDGKWKSAYYYLIGFSEEQVKLKIKEEGNYNGILKIRQGSKREFFDFEILVGSSNGEKTSEEVKKSDEKVVEENILSEKNDLGLENSIENVVDSPSENQENVISLSAEKNKESEEVLYESHNFFSLEYAPYAFCVLLIFILIILLWEKF